MMLALSRNKDPKASAPYLSRLNLSRPPFSDSVGADGFYVDPARSQILDMLQHLTQYSEELLLVSGPQGSGKSTLLDQFQQRAESHWRICRVEGGERLEADTLFSRIAECFGIDVAAAKDNLLAEFQRQLGLLQEQQLPVLIIDDAQALSDDALEIVMHLAALAGEHGKLIRIILFASASLEQRLAAERFAEMPQPHRLVIKPMEESEVAAYLAHRLHTAGYQGEALFNGREVKRLHKQSAGLPGPLNEAAHQMLQEKLSRGQSSPTGRRYLQYGLAATAVLGTVIGLNEKINGLLGGNPDAMAVTAPERPVVRLADAGNPWAVVIRDGESIQISCGAAEGDTVGVRPLMTAAAESSDSGLMGKPIMRDVTPPLSATQRATEAEEQAPAEEPPPELESEAVEESVPEQDEPPLQLAANEGALEDEAPQKSEQTPTPETPESTEEETPPAELELAAVEPFPVAASANEQELTLKGSGFAPGSKVAVSQGGRVRVLPAEKVSFTDSETLTIQVTPGEQRSDWAVQVSRPDNQRSNVLRFEVELQQRPEESVEPPSEEEATPPSDDEATKIATDETVPRSAEPEPPAHAEEGALKGHEWYARQEDGAFTLQLLASESREKVRAFARQQQLEAPLASFTMKRNDQRLHALTQGLYPDRAAAERAATELPDGLNPWVRSLQSVKQVMLAEAEAAAPSTLSGTAEGGVKDTAWVWSQAPERFTIQLAAGSDAQALESAMRQVNLPGELAVVRSQRDGGPWFALVYGSFASKEAARGTIARLPDTLKQSGPWPRSFAELQDEISRSTPNE
ncbi:MAG: SPOR domain-containing protein [Pseudomonadota bacterium]